jgi:beta-xylosidase
MVHTSGGPNTGWPLYKSRDMIHWASVGSLLDGTNRQPWMNGGYWAPEIHLVHQPAGSIYVLTGTSTYLNPDDPNDSFNNERVIVMATSNSVAGPYTVSSTPLVASSTSVNIDSHIFQDQDGTPYLYWKRNPGGGKSEIRVRELDLNDPTHFAADSSATVLLSATTDTSNANYYAWEKGVAEAPWVEKRNGYYYLFYSGGFIDASYRVGVARSTSPTGPFTRYSGNPILGNNAAWVGPGHGSVVNDAAGNWWFVYHAKHADNQALGRVVMLDQILWLNDWPYFGNGGTPSTTAQSGPIIGASGAASGTPLAFSATQVPLALTLFGDAEPLFH